MNRIAHDLCKVLRDRISVIVRDVTDPRYDLSLVEIKHILLAGADALLFMAALTEGLAPKKSYEEAADNIDAYLSVAAELVAARISIHGERPHAISTNP